MEPFGKEDCQRLRDSHRWSDNDKKLASFEFVLNLLGFYELIVGIFSMINV